MGLDTSHGCWHGPYSEFNRWRTSVARSMGINLDSMEGYGGDNTWDHLEGDPILTLLLHSDCEGSIASADCGPLADRLESLNLQDSATVEFIKGLRAAAAAGEDVEFH